VQCAESLRVQAYFDSEADAVSAAEIERHVERCAECRALLEDLAKVRTALRQGVRYDVAPAALHAKIRRALDQETQPKPARLSRGWRAPSFWTGAFAGLGTAALAAAFAFFVIVPSKVNPLTDELVSAHVRSLMPAHLIDVASTDKHTVKPWFAGHADVSPVVADFDTQGYRLIGGRADYIDHQRSAVVVYQHGAHVINVFTWAAAGARLPADTTRSGYHLACWQQGDIQYCAVSDTAWDELQGLVRLLRAQP
jgi:anti-sigma factor RsiW